MQLLGFGATAAELLEPLILPAIGAEEAERSAPASAPAPGGAPAVDVVATPSGKVSAHFSWAEAVGTASMLPAPVRDNIMLLAPALEALRTAVGTPLTVSSWYAPDNKHADGVAHNVGLAADVKSQKVNDETVALKAWQLGFAVVARLAGNAGVHVAIPPAGVTIAQASLIQLVAGSNKAKVIAPTTGRAVTAQTPYSKGAGAPAGARKTARDWPETNWTADQMMASLEPTFRAAVLRVLARLTADGHQPTMVFGWRSLSLQAWLKAKGRTKVDFSFHNALLPNGKPGALAADVVDKRYGWGTKIENGKEVNDPVKQKKAAAFFRAMGKAAFAEGIHWGGSTKTGFSQRGVWAQYDMSWDPAHLQSAHNSELGRVRKASQAAAVAQTS